MVKLLFYQIFNCIFQNYFFKSRFFKITNFKQTLLQKGKSCFLIFFFLCIFRIMIQCHQNILLTTLPMWQGGPPLLFEFFIYFLKIN